MLLLLLLLLLLFISTLSFFISICRWWDSLLLQLYGALYYTWVEIDLQTGKTVHSTPFPLDTLPELAFCMYVAQ